MLGNKVRDVAKVRDFYKNPIRNNKISYKLKNLQELMDLKIWKV